MIILKEESIQEVAQDSRPVPISSNDKEHVEKLLMRLKAKANKYGQDLNWSFSDPYRFKVTIEGTYKSHYVEAIDVTIDTGIVKKGDYTLLAHIEHTGEGNIVTPISNEAVDRSWYEIPSKCDHCKTNRFRNVTYMVQNDKTGDILQIGRSCLRDYTGIWPEGVILRFALSSYELDKSMEQDEWDKIGTGFAHAYEVETVLGLAIDSIKEFGYVRKEFPSSTYGKVWDMLTGHMEPSDMAKQKAEVIKEFASNYEGTDDIILNCKAVINSGICKIKHIGRLVYLPVAYEKELKNQETLRNREAQKSQEATTSDYIGQPGDKITVDLKSKQFITSWDNMYGVTHLYKFVDTNDNVLMWFSSTWIDLEDGQNKNATKLKGTVKSHNLKDNVKQTIVTRCKLLP